MKNKLFNLALVAFSIIFIFYPISYGLPSILKTIIILILMMLFLKFIWPRINKFIKIKEKYYLPIIIGIFLIIRIIAFIVLKDNIVQVSDFNAALNAAQNMDFHSSYYMHFVHWIFQPVVHHYLLNIFGINQMSIMIFNIILTLGITIGIYKVTESVTKTKSTSFFASLMYTLWPANIIYFAINTPEHIGSLLIIWAAYLIIKIFDNKQIEKGIIYSLLTGILLGFSVFFKNFSLVFIIAFIIYIILHLLKNKFKFKELIHYIIYLIIIFGCYSLITTSMYNIADNLVGKEVNRSIAPCYMYVSLHSNGNGNYNADLYNEYFETIDKYGYEKGNEKILDRLIKDIKNNEKFIELLNNKAINLHSRDIRVNWVGDSALANGSDKLANFLHNHYNKINSLYYMTTIILISISVINLIKNKDLKALFISLIIFGSSLMLMLVESQARYTYALLPFYTLLAAIGLQEFNKVIINKKNK